MKTETTPKTVLQWLETLPDGLREKAIHFATFADMISVFCDSLDDALISLQTFRESGSDEWHFWMGARVFIMNHGIPKSIRGMVGYNAAKAACGAENKPKCKYCDDTGVDLNSSNCICRYGLGFENHEVAYIAESPQSETMLITKARLAELEAIEIKWKTYVDQLIVQLIHQVEKL